MLSGPLGEEVDFPALRRPDVGDLEAAALQLDQHDERNDVFPLRRTPMTAKAFPRIPGSRTSRRVRVRGEVVSDSSS